MIDDMHKRAMATEKEEEHAGRLLFHDISEHQKRETTITLFTSANVGEEEEGNLKTSS